MSFKKMKDELDIFKENPRRIEKRIIVMYIKATSKLNTAEGTLTTRRKMLEELIQIQKQFSRNESSLIQRSKEVEKRLKRHRAKILATKKEVKDVTKE